MWRLTVLVMAGAALMACSSDGETENTDACFEGTVNQFATDLGSCGEAIDLGREIASGVLPDATDDGLDLYFGALCSTIQTTTGTMTAPAEDIATAAELDATGVCPGDLTRLVEQS